MNTMMSILNKSTEINERYAAKIARIDAIEPILGADRIVNAIVGVETAVVSKDFKVGDIIVMFPCETVISSKYLSAYNLYEPSEYDRNSNRDEVATLDAAYKSLNSLPSKTAEDIEAINNITRQIKEKCGFFDKHGRVRCLKLRGVYSLYYVDPVESLELVWPELNTIIWSKEIGKIFDTIGTEKICWKYVPAPQIKEHAAVVSQHRYNKSMRKLKKFDRLVPGQFKFHYDTGKLVDNMHMINPQSVIDITVKLHGTSVIISNLLVNRKLNLFEKIIKFLGFKVKTTEYGNIFSSRRVIQNQYINPGGSNGFYSTNVYRCVNRDFAEFLDPGMTVYGEIVGYEEGTNKFIQKNHDYGCKPGEWKFMPYRITTTDQNGRSYEWSISQVMEWIDKVQMILHDKIDPREDRLINMTRLYHDRAGKLYDDLYMKVLHETSFTEYSDALEEYGRTSDPGLTYTPERFMGYRNYILWKWHVALLAAMQADKDWIGMEKREPLCKNNVPREGIVIRVEDSSHPFALKLKSSAHYELERKAMDKGEIDIEA